MKNVRVMRRFLVIFLLAIAFPVKEAVSSSIDVNGEISCEPVDTLHQNPVYDAALAEKLGADAYGMKSYVLVMLKTGLCRSAALPGGGQQDMEGTTLNTILQWEN